MSKPSIILIPGSFSLPEFYDTVVDPIAAKGYEIRALHNPSSGLKTGPREGTPPTMYDDAAQIAAEAEKLADEGKDVILVAHSYGGTPTTESTKGLSKKERQAQGKKGGIVKLAYMTCLVPAVGVSAGGVLVGASEDSKLEMKIDVCASSTHSFKYKCMYFYTEINNTPGQGLDVPRGHSRLGPHCLLGPPSVRRRGLDAAIPQTYRYQLWERADARGI